jgi:AraC-like DNA-binding protein
VKSIEPQSPGSRRRPIARGSSEATVRIGPLQAIPEVLRKLGADPTEVLAGAGFEPGLFSDPNNPISHAARGRLLSHCVDRTGCRHFGLLVGQQGSLRSFGLVGLLGRYSENVETALRSLVRYFHLHNRGAAVSLAVDGDRAMLSYGAHQPHIEAADQIGDGAVAVMLNVMRELCGAGWMPIEARFAHRRPQDVGPFRRLFGVPLRFDAEQYGLAFSADWLNRPLPGADLELRQLLQREIDALEAGYGDDFPGQVRSVLRTALLADHASADRVAALFSMHSRTLNRRLHAAGTGFRELVDEGRFGIARQMLEHSTMDVSQVAAMLDYADASAFSRAFRRWSGTTPAQWRAQRRARAPRRK